MCWAQVNPSVHAVNGLYTIQAVRPQSGAVAAAAFCAGAVAVNKVDIATVEPNAIKAVRREITFGPSSVAVLASSILRCCQ